MRVLLVSILVAIFSTAALAHSGGTDSNGCHHNRKTGGYHCH
ncbi:YHYH domain-containing protein [Labrenzia sp. PO1]|nr:YHYH domain-containing protein [Labrenzia sp. PO1]NKI61769.1 YHYH domain-containing protein [Labrenzia sp. PO1]